MKARSKSSLFVKRVSKAVFKMGRSAKRKNDAAILNFFLLNRLYAFFEAACLPRSLPKSYPVINLKYFLPLMVWSVAARFLNVLMLPAIIKKIAHSVTLFVLRNIAWPISSKIARPMVLLRYDTQLKGMDTFFACVFE